MTASCLSGTRDNIRRSKRVSPTNSCARPGIETAKLDEIVRQKDPALKEVVRAALSWPVKEAMENLTAQGRVHEITDNDERLGEIAREYVKQPEGTLVVSPDNRSRREINQVIHRAMQDAGHVTLWNKMTRCW